MKKTVIFVILNIATISFYKLAYAQEEFFMPPNAMQQRYEKLPPIRLPQPKLPSAIRSNAVRDNQGQASRQIQNQQNMPQNQAKPRNVPKRRVSHYIAVDGRYIPVYVKEEPQAATVQTAQTDSSTVQNNDNTEESSAATESLEQNPTPPSLEVVDDDNDNKLPIITTDFTANDNLPPIAAENKTIDNNSSKDIQNNNIVAPKTDAISPDLPSYRNRYSQYVNDLQVFHQTGLFPENKELNQALNKMNSTKDIIIYKGQP